MTDPRIKLLSRSEKLHLFSGTMIGLIIDSIQAKIDQTSQRIYPISRQAMTNHRLLKKQLKLLKKYDAIEAKRIKNLS